MTACVYIWAFWHMKLTAIICLSDCQTIASRAQNPTPKQNFIESGILYVVQSQLVRS